jgi:hypothetical protein
MLSGRILINLQVTVGCKSHSHRLWVLDSAGKVGTSSFGF